MLPYNINHPTVVRKLTIWQSRTRNIAFDFPITHLLTLPVSRSTQGRYIRTAPNGSWKEILFPLLP